MALGGVSKKISTLADTAEKLYQRVNEMREQIQELRQTVTETKTTVEKLERELDSQRVLVEALARKQDVDVDALLAEAAGGEAEEDDAADVAGAEQGSDAPDEGE